MGLASWLPKNWSNAVTAGCVIVAALIEAWQQAASGSASVPRLDGSWHYVPLGLLVAGGIAWLVGHIRKPPLPPPSQAIQPAPRSVIPGIPTLSALHGNPATDHVRLSTLV